ncbi:MAG: hypothetical protein KDD44_05095 [Bdellovibrionales bacterium]|nr:hypothetical protein [Bdellovibrionales bacterium]
MLSYGFYKSLHYLGVFVLLLAFGGMMVGVADGQSPQGPLRKRLLMAHGIGLAIILIAGFGMLARLGIHWPWPGWLIAKLAIWLVLGGLAAALLRQPSRLKVLSLAVLVLAWLAGTVALTKPF